MSSKVSFFSRLYSKTIVGLFLIFSLLCNLSYADIIYLDVYFQTYGNTVGNSNGNCNTPFCTKGNYNISWKRSQCLAGNTPGWGSVHWFNGHFTFTGVKWDKMGTSQDHQGVCVSDPKPPPFYHYTIPKLFLFHDGCTGYPDGNPRKMTRGPNKGWNPHNWGRVFHGACVVHDLCYKAEPSFSGKSRKYCDDQMLNYAKQICIASYERKGGSLFRKNDLEKCLAEADNARFGLKLGPSAHYNAYDFPFDWRPTYKVTNYTTGVITTKSGICPSGKHYDVNSRRCATAPISCTGGRNYFSGRCYCPSGTQWTGTMCKDPNDIGPDPEQ